MVQQCPFNLSRVSVCDVDALDYNDKGLLQVRLRGHNDSQIKASPAHNRKSAELNGGRVKSWHSSFPTKHENIGLLLVQRLRRWPNNKPVVGQCLVISGLAGNFDQCSKSTRTIPLMLTHKTIAYSAGSGCQTHSAADPAALTSLQSTHHYMSHMRTVF